MARPVSTADAPTNARAAAKFAARRDELCASVLQTLGELGYARTSLREIAQNSEFSHGVLHYYFTDKIDLITSAVRMYKAQCVTRYDEIVDEADTAEHLRVGFGVAMARTLAEDGPMHRLWYDLRNQSVFEAALRPDVQEIDHGLSDMIWRVVDRYATLVGRPPQFSRSLAYAQFDGLFQHALLRHAAGDSTVLVDLSTDAADLLRTMA